MLVLHFTSKLLLFEVIFTITNSFDSMSQMYLKYSDLTSGIIEAILSVLRKDLDQTGITLACSGLARMYFTINQNTELAELLKLKLRQVERSPLITTSKSVFVSVFTLLTLLFHFYFIGCA